jgi:hypothetical protein
MQLPEDWSIPEALQDRLSANTTGRQRAMVAEGHVLLVLHEVPRHGQRQRRGIYFWRLPDGSWCSSAEKRGIPSLSEHVNDFSRAADELEARFQEAALAKDYFVLLQHLAPILRSAANMYSTLQSVRESLPEAPALISVRDTAGDVVRSLELLYTDTKNALDYDIAKSSEEQAMLGEEAVRSGVRLNILAAIFLPLSTVTGMLGVNLALGIESSPVWVSWCLFGVGLVIGLIVRGWVMQGVPPQIINPRSNADRRLLAGRLVRLAGI